MHSRSPELLCQCAFATGFAVDMWAVGCILAECVINFHMFRGTTASAVLSEHLWVSLIYSFYHEKHLIVLFADAGNSAAK